MPISKRGNVSPQMGRCEFRFTSFEHRKTNSFKRRKKRIGHLSESHGELLMFCGGGSFATQNEYTSTTGYSYSETYISHGQYKQTHICESKPDSRW